MNKKPCFCSICLGLIFLCGSLVTKAQQTIVKGIIIDDITGENISEAVVKINETDKITSTNSFGVFEFNEPSLPLGEQVLVISKNGYISKYFPIVIHEGEHLDLKKIELQYAIDREQLGTTIYLTNIELEEEASYSNIPLLQATRDVFLNAAAYDFSAAFFRIRGLGNENGKMLINGIEMNTLYNGRPEWGSWGGLNDVQRNQTYTKGISENEYIFGGLTGTSHITMRASQYRKGSRISYAMSNRSYQGRIMTTYNSGLTKNNWAFSTSLSRRYGNQGYIEGTFYDANSFFIAVEKKWGRKHALNLVGLYTPIRRGRSTAITEEVANLKGNTYNPNWGYQNGKLRNSREKLIEQPLIMCNYYWDITKNTKIQTNIAVQTGTISNSGIDVGGKDMVLEAGGEQTFTGGGRSTAINPIHPQNLPSIFLKEPNPSPLQYQNAYLATQHLIQNGQLNWDDLVITNQQNSKQGQNATYMLYDHQIEGTRIMSSMILNTRFNEHITLGAAIHYQNEKNQNFAKVKDLLGGTGFLDIDAFAVNTTEIASSDFVTRIQSDIRNPNRIVKAGDIYNYNYEIDAYVGTGFLQGQFKYRNMNLFVSATASQTSYQRNGLFENGYFSDNNSFGKSSATKFLNYGIKAGGTFAINGHHFLRYHGAYFNKAPTIRNVFVNPRQNNYTVSQLLYKNQTSPSTKSFDIAYIFRSPRVQAELTGYYTKIRNDSQVSSFFTEAITGSNTGYVQEILTDIDKLYLGGELGISYQVTPELKLKGVAAIGDFTFDNNPNSILTSTSESFIKDSGTKNLGMSFLKGYHIATGPQRVAQLGFEYRDPNYWWFGINTNYFSNAFIKISPFARTSNFYKDNDGLPFVSYDEDIAKSLLNQEELEDYFLVNAIGGKSWRVKKNYIGFFASVNNVLNQAYKTGGFEQARNANYQLALEESKRATPIYGSKYFFGPGTTYYLTVYLRL